MHPFTDGLSRMPQLEPQTTVLQFQDAFRATCTDYRFFPQSRDTNWQLAEDFILYHLLRHHRRLHLDLSFDNFNN